MMLHGHQGSGTDRIGLVADVNWDVVVIGAGVAGASLAQMCARHGYQTLLVESKPLPREKVCGGCLNLRAQKSLKALGVLDEIYAAGGVELDRLDLRVLKTRATWKIPPLLSIRRSTLDQILVASAASAGAMVLSQTQATVSFNESDDVKRFGRSVLLKCGPKTQTVSAKVVIAADGLTRSSLRESAKFHSQVEKDSRIGVQTFVDPKVCSKWLLPKTLQMCVAGYGYVGLSPTDGGWIDVAAAIDPAALRSEPSVACLVERILSDSFQSEIAFPTSLTWRFTPFLTRSSMHVSDTRLFLLGDSIGYVEPFTGEGMSWALSSSEAVLPWIEEIIARGWDDTLACRWSTWVRRQHRVKQVQCRWIARQLRYPQLAAWIVRACDLIPSLRATLIQKATT